MRRMAIDWRRTGVGRGGAVALLAYAVLRLDAIPAAAESLWKPPHGAPHDYAQFERRLATPRSGEQVLPPPVRAAVGLLREHGATGYFASPGLRANAGWHQRLTEGAWPIRPRDDAFYEVSLADEPTSCRALAVSEGATPEVRLARCD